MNKDELDEAIDLLSQCRDGEIIQFISRRIPGEWAIFEKNWRFNFSENRYRVKPDKPRICYVYFESTDITSAPTIELTDSVKDALEKAGIPYAG